MGPRPNVAKANRLKRTHGHTINEKVTPTYRSWYNALQRCTNIKNPRWKDYGGRGITVCTRWENFAHFLEDMGVKPKGLTLERVDNFKGYTPENRKWATVYEQASNRRPVKLSYAACRTIRRYRIAGASLRALAGQYSVSEALVSLISRGRKRKNK